jgi:hypothetical protein
VNVVGPDPEEPALLTIRFQLEPDPKSDKWFEYFLHPQHDPWQGFRLPERESRGMGGIGFIGSVEDDRLEEYVATIDKCVADANASFEREVVPEREAEKQRASQAVVTNDARMQKARERLDNL